MAQPTRADVYKALGQKANFIVKEETETAKQLRIIGRCLPEHWPFFQPVVHKLYTQAMREDSLWSCDISQLFMLRASKLMKGWRLIFQMSPSSSHTIEHVYGEIASVIMSAPLPARVEVDTVLLPGHKRGQMRGGVNARGKGASAAGSAPLILTRGMPR